MSKPLAIDLFCGLGGWTEALLAEGWDVIGFDIERHVYARTKSRNEDSVKRPGMNWSGSDKPGYKAVAFNATQNVVVSDVLECYPGQLVLQDVRTIHGAQFAGADLIVASPPCQEFSYRAMPWKRAKALPPPVLGTNLFWQCWRIQQEACDAAGRYIPMVVENVKGAQKWVGRARAHFGSFYLWGDVNSVGDAIVGSVPKFGELVRAKRRVKVPGFNFHQHENGLPGGSFQSAAVEALKWGDCNGKRFAQRPKGNVAAHREGSKNEGGSWFAIGSPGQTNVGQNPDGRGTKGFATGLGRGHDWRQDPSGRYNSKSSARKAASAQIAKIPEPLARHIAQVFKP